jgi:NADPH2:quinone reductase
MRALVVREPGPRAVLGIEEVDRGVPAAGEVEIAVRLTAVNFADVLIVRGRYPAAAQAPVIPGIEAVGEITRVGSGVVGLGPGDRVVALAGKGCWAEHVIVDAALVRRVPDGVDATAAASGAVVVSTAELAVRQARLVPCESVLVHGATGGVGSVMAAVSKHYGAGLVVGTGRDAARCEQAASFGYDFVVETAQFDTRVNDLTAGRGVDIVFDGVGGALRRRSLEVLAPFGRLVVVGNATQEIEPLPSGAALRGANIGVLGSSLGALIRGRREMAGGSLERALRLIELGVVSVSSSTMPLPRAPEAVAMLESRVAVGKMVLVLDH